MLHSIEKQELEEQLLEKKDGNFSTKSGRTEASVWIILPSCIITSFMFIGMIPLLPRLQILWFEDYKHAQYYSGILTAIQAALTFFTSPQIGQISDVYGRKPVMVLTAVFMFFPPFFLYLTSGTSYKAYYGVKIFAGLFGVGQATSFAFISAYIADSSKPEERTKHLGLVSATAGVAMTVTPLLNKLSIALEMEDFLLLLSLLGVLNVLYLIFIVPESKVFTNVEQNEKKQLFKVINPLKPLKLIRQNRVMFFLAIVIFLGQVPEAGVAQIAVLYLNEVYGLVGKQIQEFDSLVFSAMGISLIISQSIVLQTLLKYKAKFSTIIVISQLANCVHMIFYGSIQLLPQWMFFLNCIPIGLVFIFPTAVDSFLSFNIPASEYGLALGTLGSIKGICGIIGPLLFSEIYSITGNGTPFFIGAFIAFFSVLVSWHYLPKLEAATSSSIQVN